MHRIDHEQNLTSLAEIEEALQQCFRAKNSMITTEGFSPEQAVLGKATRLPASMIADENNSAHHMCLSDDQASKQFKRSLDLRVAARSAFWQADNSAAIRRASLRRSRGTVHEWLCGQLCVFWDKRKAPNMLEKGRWCGPAQIVCQESRTIVWITHMNRLLRCAHENLRPVSMREFQKHSTFQVSNTQAQLQDMARKLPHQLKERSGMFQFSDLSDIGPCRHEDNEGSEPDSHGRQPEEEPFRKQSMDIPMTEAMPYDLAVETPVPETPFSPRTAAMESSLPSPSVGVTPSEPDTASLDTDNSEHAILHQTSNQCKTLL